MESGRNDLERENSVEINGTAKAKSSVPLATYKSLPDDDSNWQGKKDEKNSKMVISNTKNEVDEEAKEKMLNDSVKITPLKDTPEVIFISENGDTKINIGNIQHSLSGMGKEELMKYANDPFWVKLRWFLFILFWFLWFAMLGGAISIIIMAPKCTSPAPKTWWEKSPIVQLGPIDIAGKDLLVYENLLDTLKNQSINIISLYSILKESSKDHVVDFKDVNIRSGLKMEDLKEFIKIAKQKNQKILLEFNPNYSGKDHYWFNQSVHRIEPYKDYYVWADGKSNTEKPNNWLSIDEGSAWEFNEKRKQYYLHQFKPSQPDFNFNNPLVVKEFSDIFLHWIGLGIDGFRLGTTMYLTEDENRFDEKGLAELHDYKSLNHVFTKNRHTENSNILKQWREVIANATENIGLFALKDDIGDDAFAVFNDNKRLIDLPQPSKFLAHDNASINAKSLQSGIEKMINQSWPGWNFNGGDKLLQERVGPSTAESLILMGLLLPGTPILKLSDVTPVKEAFKILAAKRNEETFLYGEFKTYIVNETVFVYTRLKSGFPGYLVAFQTSTENNVDIDLSKIPHMSSEVTVLAHSSNYNRNVTTFSERMTSNKVPISSKSTLVLTFVAKA